MRPSDLLHSISLNQLKLIPPQTFWLIVGVTTLLILYFLYQSYKQLKRARILEDTPTAKIRSAAQGYVELSGEQRPLQKTEHLTPLSHSPCTWYRYAIEYYDRKNGWRLLEQGSSSSLFLLQDGTGQCVIDPKGAEISTPMVDHWQGFSRYPKRKPATWFGRIWGAIGNYRYTEWTMHDAMPLYAMGNFHTYSVENFIALYPNYRLDMQSDENIHLLSKEGLDQQNPFVLSADERLKSIRKYRINSFLWFLAYLFILAGLATLVIARLN